MANPYFYPDFTHTFPTWVCQTLNCFHTLQAYQSGLSKRNETCCIVILWLSLLQVLTLGGNAVLMLSLIICSVLMQQESYRLFSLIIVQVNLATLRNFFKTNNGNFTFTQERLDLFLKISMGLGAFSTLFTLVLIGTSHKDDFIFSWPALKLKVRLDNLKQRYGMRCFKQVAISIRMALLVIGIGSFLSCMWGFSTGVPVAGPK